MFAVASGEVEIRIGDQLVDSIAAGGIFGEMGLIDNQARSADAYARTTARIVSINERRFGFLVQNNPFFALHVMRSMTSRLRKLSTESPK
jgi:CRP/FNR family cyclic AMP-dependent transcriptional regulator